MPRFFVPAAQIVQSRTVLSGPEFHHLRHVLRFNVGDSIMLCDEQGREYQGAISSLSATTAEITITATPITSRNRFVLTLAQGLLKGQKMDFVIEKATELGVAQILPFFSAFTVAQLPEERRNDREARWQRIAQSAAKQSGSPIPRIAPPQAFKALLTTIPHETGKILLYEKEQQFPLKMFAQTQPQFSSLYIVVGSEGGFSAEEVEQARAAGMHVVGLGTRTLRAETAGIVAVTLCQFLWGESGLPPLLSPR
jgi:16S rRNA (uracil1498-N3)-methyltransferase